MIRDFPDKSSVDCFRIRKRPATVCEDPVKFLQQGWVLLDNLLLPCMNTHQGKAAPNWPPAMVL